MKFWLTGLAIQTNLCETGREDTRTLQIVDAKRGGASMSSGLSVKQAPFPPDTLISPPLPERCV
jgi:hypothetical protein